MAERPPRPYHAEASKTLPSLYRAIRPPAVRQEAPEVIVLQTSSPRVAARCASMLRSLSPCQIHALAAITFLTLFAALGFVVILGQTGRFDVLMIRLAQDPPGLAHVAWFFNHLLNQHGIPALWALSIAGCVAARRWHAASFFAFAWLISPATYALKLLVDRPRPFGPFSIREFPADPSFPSGHTTLALGFFGAWFMLAAYLLPAPAVRPVRALGVLAILMTGYFRLWAGAHWPTDVLASLLFGSAFLLALWTLHISLANRLPSRFGAFAPPQRPLRPSDLQAE